ncbi:MAG: ROK family protein [Xanthomonadales bacterium]|nr:ROK family protein [Xanthomonadales bacterium]MCW5579369.1 glucokinase [Dokdonella sp.]MDL1869494.1 ROK family protein [Gammaproteobacteria bacterium PRO6]
MASNPRAKASAQRLLIAADVGGTHARLALVGIAADGHVEILQHEKYACAAFAGLADIVEAFRRAAGAESVDEIAMACAGFVVEGEVVNENLPWLVSVPQLRERLRSTHLAVVNDFKALAYAVADARDALVTLQRGVATDGTLPSVAIGPGTGLGSAVCIPQRGAMVVLATEAGHAQLTPGSELELDLLREFRRSEAYVKTEHALSGPGLVNLHRALARLHGVAPVFDTPAAISTAAHRGDATALDTVRVFCGWLGSVVGDLVLGYGAFGGVHLAGGVLPQLGDLLADSDFLARFLDKGPMRAALERVPVRLVEHGQLGITGAAIWYLQHTGE